MSYPIFKNKHLEEAIIFPDHTGRDRKKFRNKIPKKCIITYQDEAFQHIIKKFRAQRLKVKSLWGCNSYYTKNFIVVQMKGVGSPHSTIMLENLIAIGIKEFINIGIAGGLKQLGIFLCSRAIRDEGTSQHYMPHSMYAYPDKRLTKRLRASLNKLKVKFYEGTNWTIDAPYMETKAELKSFKKQGVLTVEMEASALFSVAKLRKVSIAAAFVTSDILGDEWKNLYMNKEAFILDGLRKLSNAAALCFKI